MSKTYKCRCGKIMKIGKLKQHAFKCCAFMNQFAPNPRSERERLAKEYLKKVLE